MVSTSRSSEHEIAPNYSVGLRPCLVHKKFQDSPSHRILWPSIKYRQNQILIIQFTCNSRAESFESS